MEHRGGGQQVSFPSLSLSLHSAHSLCTKRMPNFSPPSPFVAPGHRSSHLTGVVKQMDSMPLQSNMTDRVRLGQTIVSFTK